jgi:hypothetical protein
LANYSNTDVCAFTKISGSEKVVVMINLRSTTKTFVIPSAMAGSYTNAYTGAAVTLTSGATQSLSAYQYIVLVNSGTTGGTYYAIKNRWKGTYLYDAGANVGYGTSIANNNYKWQKVAVDDTYFLLKNLGTGEYMHIENQTGSAQCTAADPSWWSAQWSQENIDGTWVRIRNRWQTTSIIHVENQTGSAQYVGAQNAWYSAHWQLETTSGRLSTEETTETGVSDLSAELYPNPSTDKQFFVNVKGLKNNETATMTLHDTNGKVTIRSEIDGLTRIDHNLPSGLYLVRVRAGEKFVVKKLLIN